MCIGYDPFRWADIYQSEEEYIKDLIKDEERKKNEQSND